jgi:hypothetical protein
VVATEFVGTSISSTWPEPIEALFRENIGRNPQVHFYNSRKRGQLLSTITPSRCHHGRRHRYTQHRSLRSPALLGW